MLSLPKTDTTRYILCPTKPWETCGGILESLLWSASLGHGHVPQLHLLGQGQFIWTFSHCSSASTAWIKASTLPAFKHQSTSWLVVCSALVQHGDVLLFLPQCLQSRFLLVAAVSITFLHSHTWKSIKISSFSVLQWMFGQLISSKESVWRVDFAWFKPTKFRIYRSNPNLW